MYPFHVRRHCASARCSRRLHLSIARTLEGRVVVGSRVVVPLGKNKRYTGIVIRLHEELANFDEERIKTVEELVDERPLLLEEQIALWRWMAQYYMCCPGEVMKAALPAGLKLESETLFAWLKTWIRTMRRTMSKRAKSCGR